MAGARPDGSHLKQTVLRDGLLCVTERLPHVRSVALGLSFGLGGRDDPPGSEGLAHFVEHMVFKGTGRRSARDISIAAERLGADLNAFTDKEQTCFMARFPGDRQREVTGLLAEVVSGPAFDAGEVEKEKSVVGEEIKTAEEDPDLKAGSLMYRALYGDTPMGNPVVGTAEAVQALDADGLRRQFRQRYHASTGVVVAVGDVSHELVVDVVSREFRVPAGNPVGRSRERAAEPAVKVQTRPELTQVHVYLTRPAFAYPDERRYPLSVLNTVLGGGSSSRLFQRLREDEALVYSVSSFVELHGDSGLVGIYFATDRGNLERCMSILGDELRKLRRDRVSAEEFERALNMTRSSVLLGLEGPTSRMLRLARTHHLIGRLLTVDDTLEAYNRVELDDVNGLVEPVLGEGGFHAGAVGPIAADEFGGMVEDLTG